MSNEIRFPRDAPPGHVTALQKWLSQWSSQQQIAPDRVQRWVAFELIIAAFEQARIEGEPKFLVKGGYAIEARLGLRARATKDIDAVLRSDASFEEILDHVTDTLKVKLCSSAASFKVVKVRQIGTTQAADFQVQVLWHERVFCKVKLQVSPDEARSTVEYDNLSSPSRSSDFGITDLPEELVCLELRYQIAQKIHAVTNPREGNDRFRDLIDIQLLDSLYDVAFNTTLREACLDIFATRATHSWPPTITQRDTWAEGYRALAESLEFEPTDAIEAIAVCQIIIDRIAAAVNQ